MAEKEELLEELYGLRAGLSVYSEEADALQKIEMPIWHRERENIAVATESARLFIEPLVDSGYYFTHDYGPVDQVEFLSGKSYGIGSPLIKRLSAEWKLDTKFLDIGSRYWDEDRSEETEEKCKEQSELVEKIYGRWLVSEEMKPVYLSLQFDQSKQKLADAQKELLKCRSKHRKNILLTALSAFLAVAALVVYLLFGAEQSNLLKYVTIGVAAICTGLFLLSFLQTVCYKSYRQSKKSLKSLEEEMRRPEKTETMFAIFQARDNLNALMKEREEKTYPIFSRAEEFYKALQKQYTSVLDERNWKNLDLVIFALETGRAENLKEALQYTDGEMRTRRIERAIQQATSQICSTIRSGFASLVTTIHNCCNQLSAQIQTIGGQILATNQQILNTQREMLSEQRFSNALLAKADVTSMQLMNDVHKIRGNSDYLNMRLRNG